MERIHVSVRARPLSEEDAKSSPWKISGNSVFMPNLASPKFDFDRVFGEDCKTEEIYRVRTKEIVAAAVGGFNGTVFAYGQTNSGKTHTMRGSATEPGVIPLAVGDLFETIHEDVDREFLLRMSYMEIYNEDINDLLAPEHRKLQIHENLERGIYVAGLREEIVVSPEQVLELMQFGESHRHIGETNMNVYSSRSHTIFRMIIESRERNENEDIRSSCDAVRVSVLNLVDLAGSERAAKTGAEGVRLKEGSHINRSLMTLGTVIKKLSEGAESQGGHVPYRDSKLTRILQPALGGNANTAIICNITLAQIHADETKSSLQFASRALRVTNHAHVNEILTDAALLKRQKKEIEELRAKLQGSHSEHLEKEILNLRNTLLQSELERERMALALEEEKRSQAEREKVLQEQAKKIKNLSSMVLYSSRDENSNQFKKRKRRDTWCPSNLSRQACNEVHLNLQPVASALKPARLGREMGVLLPFEALVNENEVSENFCQQRECCEINASEDCSLPNPCALLHVTSRRKRLPRKKSSPMDNELVEMQAEYEELLLKLETERTLAEIKIDCLTRKLAEATLIPSLEEGDLCFKHGCKSVDHLDRSLSQSDAILVIKQLQEKINIMEMDKSSSQQNLDSIVELATEQNLFAREKLEELQKQLQDAREEARAAHEQLANESARRYNTTNPLSSSEVPFDSLVKLSGEIAEFVSECQSSTKTLDSAFSIFVDMFQSLSAAFDMLSELRCTISQSSHEQKMLFHDHEKLYCSLRQRAAALESEKGHSIKLQKQLQELQHDSKKNQTESLKALSEQHDYEKAELVSHIEVLEKEISCLSSCSWAKEKESLRKDLEKTKMKLKDTEFKLKNAIQDKTKLESEKAFAEREIKRLHGQNSLLERDINKRESLAGWRRDSVVESSAKFEPKRSKGLAASFEQTMQEDYRKLEVLAFEMEATISSLEEEVAVANKEKEEALLRNESLASELEVLFKKLNESSSETNALQEEISGLRLKLEESTSDRKIMEESIKSLLEEKEELGIQLADNLMKMEEEKAIWSAKEKASILAINEQALLHKAEISSLSGMLSEVKNQLESCRDECKELRVRLMNCENNLLQEKKRSTCEPVKTEQPGNLEATDNQSKEFQENIRQQLFSVTIQRDELLAEIKAHQINVIEMESTRKHFKDLFLDAKTQVEQLNARIFEMEAKKRSEDIATGTEKAKLRMRLRGTQAKLDAFRFRYKEVVEESEFMNQKYEDASKKLKGMIASYGVENLNLKKQLAVLKSQCSS